MTPLTKQLEDKKKGCLHKRWSISENKEIELTCKEISLIEFGNSILCKECQAEIAILEQAIAEIKKRDKDIDELAESSTFALCALMKENKELKAEIKKQRQDFERLIDEVKNNEFNEDKTKELAKIVPEWSEGYYKGINNFIQTLKQQLNQPKTE